MQKRKRGTRKRTYDKLARSEQRKQLKLKRDRDKNVVIIKKNVILKVK